MINGIARQRRQIFFINNSRLFQFKNFSGLLFKNSSALPFKNFSPSSFENSITSLSRDSCQVDLKNFYKDSPPFSENPMPVQTISSSFFSRMKTLGYDRFCSKESIYVRIAKATLPLFAYHDSLKTPVAIASRGTEVINLFRRLELRNAAAVIETTIAVAAFASLFFCPNVHGMIKSGNELIKDTQELISVLKKQEIKKAAEILARMLSSSLSIALCLSGTFEMMIVSLGFQIVLGLYKSQGDLRGGDYIKAASQFLLSCIRGCQLKGENEGLQPK